MAEVGFEFLAIKCETDNVSLLRLRGPKSDRVYCPVCFATATYLAAQRGAKLSPFNGPDKLKNSIRAIWDNAKKHRH